MAVNLANRGRRLLSIGLLGLATCGPLAGGDPGTDRPRLSLSGAEAFACEAVEGELVVLVSLQWGAVVISAEPFTGAVEVGRIEQSKIHLSIPGLRMPELQIDGHGEVPDGATLWGRRIASADRLKGAPGCAAMTRPETDEALARGVHDLTAQVLAGES